MEEQAAETQADVTITRGTVVGAPQQPITPLVPGQRFHQYELIRELGHGGAGTVFLARDRKLGRKVAIKFLASSSAEMNKRFLAEAATTAQCTHENIVVIHEINEIDGRPYMVMEYLEGETLRVTVKNGRAPVPRIAELMVPVVRALKRAHEFGIVHCDLKPANIILTRSGTLKVLDFGIAQLLHERRRRESQAPQPRQDDATTGISTGGRARGTPRYMAPEQFRGLSIDHRSDLWAVGSMLREMAVGQHFLAGKHIDEMAALVSDPDVPIQPVAEVAPHVPPNFAAIADKCLAKRKEDRYPDAAALLEDLEDLLPGRGSKKLGDNENPYPGLAAFQESDADRFFGRDNDVRRLITHLRDHALVGVVGPSGVGKSSFIRAGLVPTMRREGVEMEVLIARPGRRPLAMLADLLDPMTTTLQSTRHLQERGDLTERLRKEPGFAGTMLRERARETGTQILLFVDQFEELYTLVDDPAERAHFVSCLAAIGDDPGAPLRLVVSLRSDFLDRVSEHPEFMEDLSRGLVFLRPLDRDGLFDALVEPVRNQGYHFEDESIVDEMISSLETTPGALPLLQFTASKLWLGRDRDKKLLQAATYRGMGGVEGTLSAHADDVVTRLPVHSQRLVRSIFQRLVTSESTRAIVGLDELRELSSDPDEVQRLLDLLVDGRLLVVQGYDTIDGAMFEIVHESLITNWPRLRRWLEENVEDSAFMRQLRVVAKQWHEKGRPLGLLWRGGAAAEASHWAARNKDTLPQRERDFLDGVLALRARNRRLRRGLTTGAVVFLLCLVAAGSVALILIRDAEQAARQDAARAMKAEQAVVEKLRVIEAKEAERLAAERATEAANAAVAESRDELRQKNEALVGALDGLKVALDEAEQQRAVALEHERQAVTEAGRARSAEATVKQLATDLQSERDQLKQLLERERARVEQLEQQRVRISVDELEDYETPTASRR